MISLPNLADGEDKSSPFVNRVRKNYKHIRKWAKRTLTDAFRIYDREVPGYPLAIDFYAGRFCVHYFARSKEVLEAPPETKQEINGALKSSFGINEDVIYWRTRLKPQEKSQYEKAGQTQEFFTVLEYGVKFRINLTDYLDTGLFLDHRETRQLVANISKDKKLLNLFAYTCSFSVQAAMRGASFTKSVDMSNTYTEWGKENFLLNSLSLKNNPIVRADVLKFLDEAVQRKEKYDLIVIDPPTISRSKKMEQLFDIQRDYLYLIRQSLKLLDPGGMIFFSTNSRRFSFDESEFPDYQILDITKKTLPIDFHDEKIHRCWKISPNSPPKDL